MAATPHPVLLFDGVCNLCSAAVHFVIPRDPAARVRFASLQSAVGQRLLQERGIDAQVLDSVVLIEGERWYRESDAVLQLCRYLRAPWKALTVLRAIPRPIRNWAYRLVATHRYRWFGRKETCWLPTPDLRSRFLD